MLLLRLSLIALLTGALTECRVQLPREHQKQSSMVKHLVKKTEHAVTQSRVYKFSTRYWYYILFAMWALYIQPADTFKNWYYIKLVRDYIGGALPKEKNKDFYPSLISSPDEGANTDMPNDPPISLEPIIDSSDMAMKSMRNELKGMNNFLEKIHDNTDKTKFAGPIHDFFKSLKPYAKLDVDTPFKFSPCIFYKPMCNDFKSLLKKIRAYFYDWLDENEDETEREEDSCECREEC